MTGRPGVGKTTLIERVVAMLDIPYGGFVTKEVRSKGQRVGFRLRTFMDEEVLIAHINFAKNFRVGRYGVDLSAIEGVGIKAINHAVALRKLLIIDEIGRMELLSPMFCDMIKEVVVDRYPLLATITTSSHPVADWIKQSSGMKMHTVTRDNRNSLPLTVLEEIRLIYANFLATI